MNSTSGGTLQSNINITWLGWQATLAAIPQRDKNIGSILVRNYIRCKNICARCWWLHVLVHDRNTCINSASADTSIFDCSSFIFLMNIQSEGSLLSTDEFHFWWSPTIKYKYNLTIATYLENAWCDLIQTSHSSLLWWSYGLYNCWWNIDFSFQSYGTSFVKLKAIFHMANSNFTSKLWSLHFPILEYRCKCTRDGRIMRL
jgi:hypothetical protein